MKTFGFKIAAFATLLLSVFSCSTDDSQLQEEAKGDQEVSFVLNIGDMNQTKGGELDFTACDPSKTPTKVYVEFTKKSGATGIYPIGHTFKETLDIITVGSTVKTKPIIVDPGTYDLEVITVQDGLSTVLYSGVCEDAPLAPFIPEGETLKKEFTVKKYEKPNLSVWVLCTYKKTPTEFGMPIFMLQKKEVHRIPIFINLCDEYGDHTVAEGVLYTKDETGTKTLFTTHFESGKIDYLTFADDLDIDDEDEIFTLVFNVPGRTLNTYQVSVKDLKEYFIDKTKTSAMWNEEFKFIHLDCDTEWDVPGKCDCSEPLNISFEEYNSLGEMNTGNCGWKSRKMIDGVAAYWNGILGSYISLVNAPAYKVYDEFGLHFIEEKEASKAIKIENPNKDGYTWITPQYKFEKGQKLTYKFFGKNKPEHGIPTATITMKLLDSDLKEIPGWKDKQTIIEGTQYWKCGPKDCWFLNSDKCQVAVPDGCYRLVIKIDFCDSCCDQVEYVMLDDITLR